MPRCPAANVGFLGLAAALAPAGFGQASFQGLGDLPGMRYFSRARAVSGDGRVVVGVSYSEHGTTGEEGCCEGFRWTAAEGMIGLGDLPESAFESEARAISRDGSVVVGDGHVGVDMAVRWIAGDLDALPELPGGGYGGAAATGISADGLLIVGYDNGGNGVEAFIEVGGVGGDVLGLSDLPDGKFESRANAISADGTTVVGMGTSGEGREAFRWTSAGMRGLGDLAGGRFSSEAFGVSGDGSVVVGAASVEQGTVAFRWTEAGGMEPLGALSESSYFSEALGVSADGGLVVGRTNDATGQLAFIWTESGGTRDLREALAAAGADVTGWTFRTAYGISAEGTVIVGEAQNPAGDKEAFRAVLPRTCRPDCNGDGRLNINDFICMQAKWRAREAYGDYDGSGTYTVNDFIRFQADFVKGCP